MTQANSYDALLLVSFGGPETQDQVIPFLERISHGRKIPESRLAEVAERYNQFDGVSPINERMRSLSSTVSAELETRGHDLPVFWGNRNAPPFLTDVVADLRDTGVKRVLAWIASPYSSYPSCRQYREDLDAARQSVGSGSPVIDRVRPHHDHPGLIETAADRLTEALAQLPSDRRAGAHLLFSAHSIPVSMAETCAYEEQIVDAAQLVSQIVDPKGRHPWDVVWQSRSGSPQTPWLEPDIGDRITELSTFGTQAIATSPIGFAIENFEIKWDLDIEAANRAQEVGIAFARAQTADNDPRFASMLVDLYEERIFDNPSRRSLGALDLRPDICPKNCCPAPTKS